MWCFIKGWAGSCAWGVRSSHLLCNVNKYLPVAVLELILNVFKRFGMYNHASPVKPLFCCIWYLICYLYTFWYQLSHYNHCVCLIQIKCLLCINNTAWLGYQKLICNWPHLCGALSRSSQLTLFLRGVICIYIQRTNKELKDVFQNTIKLSFLHH